MPSSIENPFTNYEPPMLHELYTEGFKRYILVQKMESITEKTKKAMLKKDIALRFSKARNSVRFRYDLSQVRPYMRREGKVKIDGHDEDVDLVISCVATGIEDAMKEKGVDGCFDDAALRVAYEFSTQYPDIVIMQASLQQYDGTD